jgi:uncharacterized protein (TIGR00288 family)
MSKNDAFVFIDGNNFYHNLRRMFIPPRRVDFRRVCEKVCEKCGLKLKRIIYYNSVPNIRTIGEENYHKHMLFLDGLKADGIVVKTRKLQHLSNAERVSKKLIELGKLQVCEKCRPLVTQNCIDCVGDFEEKEKGVDVMIAVDMIDMALKELYDAAVLVSGDSDFGHALTLIKENGKKAVVAALSSGFSSEIRNTHEFTFIDEIVLSTLKK